MRCFQRHGWGVLRACRRYPNPASQRLWGTTVRWHASSSGSHPPPPGAPNVPAGGATHQQQLHDAALGYQAPPPRPQAYVPPEQRAAGDASLEYLPEEHPMKQEFKKAAAAEAQRVEAEGPQLGSTQEWAPRIASWSDGGAAGAVEGGAGTTQVSHWEEEEPTVHNPRVISRGDYDIHHHHQQQASAGSDTQRRGTTAPLEGETGGSSSTRSRSQPPGEQPEETLHRSDAGEDAAAGAGGPLPGRRKPTLTRTQEMELAAQKLERSFGFAEYPDLLAAFQKEYEVELRSGKQASEEDRVYTEEEERSGLKFQPVDYQRSSKKLQLHLQSGPRAYDPITVLQQQGMMRFQGYAFPPTTELGKLKGDEDWSAVDHRYRHGSGSSGAIGVVRRAFYAMVGRDDPRHQHIVPAPNAGERQDTSLIYRMTRLDVVQRRQMKYMLTDFDYGDRQTAFHVMMTYPYTDWIHVFYMLATGISLYYLQLHFNAYDFYDEYLGLDLRQAPSAKKPFIAGLTTMVMVFILFQPLLVASIATTRIYRIIRRRPIGPP